MDQRRKRLPKALFVIDNLAISGAEKVALNLLFNAKKHGLPWDGLIYMDNHFGSLPMGVPLRSFAEEEPAVSEGFLSRMAKALSRLSKLRQLAQEYDILVGVTPPSMLWCFLAVVGLKTKAIAWVHYDLQGIKLEPYKPGRKLRDFLLFSLYTKFIPLCRRRAFISDAVKMSFGKSESMTDRVINNIVEPVGFSDETDDGDALCSIRQDRGQGRIPLLFLARISRQKQWEKALEVMEALDSSHPGKFTLHFIGDGPEASDLKSAVRSSSASKSLRVFGFQSNPMPIISASSAVLLTSLHEAWPTIILEAFHLGTPVFSLDCPSGPADMLGRSCSRGWLSKSPREMADQIIKHFETANDSERRAMTANAYAYLQQFDPSAIVSKWERFFIDSINAESKKNNFGGKSS